MIFRWLQRRQERRRTRAQITWAMNYIRDRYGPAWYGRGGSA